MEPWVVQMDPWDVKIVKLFTTMHHWVVEVELWVGHMDLHRDANTRDAKMVNLLMMVHLWVMVQTGPRMVQMDI